jgi:hypothetical protein
MVREFSICSVCGEIRMCASKTHYAELEDAVEFINVVMQRPPTEPDAAIAAFGTWCQRGLHPAREEGRPELLRSWLVHHAPVLSPRWQEIWAQVQRA